MRRDFVAFGGVASRNFKVLLCVGLLFSSILSDFAMAATPGTDVVVTVRHAPSNSGRIEGSVRLITAENVTLNGSGTITSALLVPGTPSVILNGHPSFGGTIAGSGSAQPSNYQITLNGTATLGNLITRTDPVSMSTVSTPPASTGTRDVTIDTPGQDPGNFATIRNLTLNGNVGPISVPPGNYGNLIANGGSSFVFGVANSTSVYNVNSLTLNGGATLTLAGPVSLTSATSVTLNGNAGVQNNPSWMSLNISGGGLTVNGNAAFYGNVLAPVGHVTVNGNTLIQGSVICDRLTVNGNGLIKGGGQGTNQAPTLVTAATANPNPVIATTTALSVAAADDGGESNLIYTWQTVETPPAPVTFGANASNAAKSTTATFTRAGNYTFQVTVQDGGGLTVTSSVAVIVNQTVTTISVAPPNATTALGGTQQFSASAADQFGIAVNPAPTFSWAVSGGGSISSTGLFAAGQNVGGPFNVTATSGAQTGTAKVSVADASPTIATAASANPNPASGTQVTLSVLGADDGGEANLTYTWSSTGTPPAPVNFSLNGTNAAKTTVATFGLSGTYTFHVTVSDLQGLTATSNVTVNVTPTITSISVTPANATVSLNGTQQFSASARDQFGIALATQPAFTWAVDGGGTVDGTGIFTAAVATGGTYHVSASSGGKTGSSVVTIVDTPPTVRTAAASSPNPVIGKSAVLTVLGADDGGEQRLTYTWDLLGTPPGAVTFSVNGTHDAQNVTATFTRNGSYNFRATISDASGQTVISTVVVPVNQTPTSMSVSPANATVNLNGTQQFTATIFDQFGDALVTQPASSWTAAGGGTITPAGLFTAGVIEGGPFAISATSGALTATATIRIVNASPIITVPASATPNPVAGSQTNLSVQATDDGGEPALKYTWSTTGTPPAPVAFSANGTNAAKNSTATFTKSGSYNFLVTISDAGGLNATSSVSVLVNQTFSSISVAPAASTLNLNGMQQFSATAMDQFGNPILTQPTITWTATGGGTINPTGMFTAAQTPGTFSAVATSGAVSGSAAITIVDNIAPTIFNFSPQDGSFINNNQPTISASYNDVGSGIDIATLHVLVDGNVVAPVINPAGFVFSPGIMLDGKHTIDVTISDKSGNTTHNTSNFTIDTIPPAISGLADKVAEATSANGAIVNYAAATATDALTANPTIGNSQASGTQFPIGVTVVSVTATDAAGNSSTATFKITVQDTVSPVVTPPADVTVYTSDPSGSVVNYAPATVFDAVTPNPTVVYSQTSGTKFAMGTTFVTITATDAAGNVGAASFNVVVLPSLILTPPADVTVGASDANGAFVSYVSATVADGYDPAPTVTYSRPSGSLFPIGVTNVVVTAIDNAGQFATASFNITVTALTVTPPNDLSVSGTSVNGAIVSYAPATITDVLDPAPVIVYSQASGTQFPLGTTAVNITVNDAFGNHATATFNVTVNPLSILAPASIVVQATGPDGAIVNYPPATTIDYVDPTITYSQDSGTVFPIGSTTVTATAVDLLGNSASADFTVTVVSPLTITPPADVFTGATAGNNALVTFPPAVVSDPADPAPIITYSQNSGTLFPIGTTQVTVTATDQSGITATATFNVNINSSIILSRPDDVTVPSTGANSATVTFPDATVTDFVDPSPVVSYSQASGTTFPVGTTPVTVNVSDAAGNTASTAFNVTVSSPLTLTTPANVVAQATDVNGAIVNYAAATASDSTDPAPIVTYSQSTGSIFPLGVTPVTVTATDASGNSITGIFTVTVNALTLSAPADIVVTATGPNTTVVNYAPAVSSDVLDPAPVIVYSQNSGTTFPLGTTNVSITATDLAGNSASASFNVIVSSPLTITPPADVITQATMANGAILNLPSASVSDPLDANPTLIYSPAGGSLFTIGTTVVTVVAKDASGNVAEASFNVTVTSPLSILPLGDVNVQPTGADGAIVTYAPATINDAVDLNPVTTYSPASGSQFPLGLTAVSVAAVDSAGNTAQANFNVIVADTLAPVITAPSDVVAEATDLNGAVVNYSPAMAVDNLTVAPIISYSQDSGTLFPIGFTRVVVNATDEAGNTSMSAFNVTVNTNNLRPVAAMPATASLSTVIGNSVSLSALGADAGGESGLSYSWSATGLAPAPVLFSDNEDNSAKDTTVTFTHAGDYDFTAVITNPDGDTTTTTVHVSVPQTLSRIVVTPNGVTVAANGSQQYSAEGFDQFNVSMMPQPAFTWTVSGGGSIDSTGLFTAGTGGGAGTRSVGTRGRVIGGGGGSTFLVTASSNGISAGANVTVGTSNVTLTITQPTLNNSVFNAPANIAISADASSTGGTITKVEFFAGRYGTVKIGEADAAPYTAAWNSVAAGLYGIRVKATDSTGASTEARLPILVLYEIVDLGTIPAPAGGSDSSTATSINNNDQIVGYTNGTPFIWENGAMTALPPSVAGVKNINDAGQIAGAVAVPNGVDANGVPQYINHAAIISAGGGTSMVGPDYSAGIAINNKGEMILLDQVTNTYRLKSGATLNFFPLALNDNGKAVGGSGGQHPFFFDRGFTVPLTETPTYIGVFPEGTNPVTGSSASAININDEIVGVANGIPALWGGCGGQILLSDLSGPEIQFDYGSANAINNSGDIVGGVETVNNAFPGTEAIIWMDGKSPVRLDSMIPLNTGWVLATATGINDYGDIIGNGIHNGVNHAYLLRSKSNVSADPNKDTTPPVIYPPADMLVQATGPDGAFVDMPFVTATDNVTVSPLVTFTPQGLFPIGKTQVTITAKDEACNESTATFNVTVVRVNVDIDGLDHETKTQDPGKIIKVNDDHSEAHADGSADNSDSSMADADGNIVVGQAMAAAHFEILSLDPDTLNSATVTLQQVGTGRVRVFATDGAGAGHSSVELLAPTADQSGDISTYVQANSALKQFYIEGVIPGAVNLTLQYSKAGKMFIDTGLINVIQIDWVNHENDPVIISAEPTAIDEQGYTQDPGQPGGIGGFGGPHPGTGFTHFQDPFRIENLRFNSAGPGGLASITCDMISNVSSIFTNAQTRSNSFVLAALGQNSSAYASASGSLGLLLNSLPSGVNGQIRTCSVIIFNPIFGSQGAHTLYETGIGTNVYCTRRVTAILRLPSLIPDPNHLETIVATLNSNIPGGTGATTTGAVPLVELGLGTNIFASADGSFVININRITVNVDLSPSTLTATVSNTLLGVSQSIDAIETARGTLEFNTDQLHNNDEVPLEGGNVTALLNHLYRIAIKGNIPGADVNVVLKEFIGSLSTSQPGFRVNSQGFVEWGGNSTEWFHFKQASGGTSGFSNLPNSGSDPVIIEASPGDSVIAELAGNNTIQAKINLVTVEVVTPVDVRLMVPSPDDKATVSVAIGLWDHAFGPFTAATAATAFTEGANLRNGAAAIDNFVGHDSRRFYFRVTNPAAVHNKDIVEDISASDFTWHTDTTEDGVDIIDDMPANAGLTLRETGPGTGVFVSKPVMLVTDDVDKAVPTHSGYTDPGFINPAPPNSSNHRLRKISNLDAKVVATYFPNGPNSITTSISTFAEVFSRSPEYRKNLRIQLYSFVSFPSSDPIWDSIRVMRNVYARLGINLVTVVDPAITLTCTNGVDQIGVIPVPAGVTPTSVGFNDYFALISSVPPVLTPIVRIFLVTGLDTANDGQTFAPRNVRRPFLDLTGCTFLRNRANLFAMAHEVGHSVGNKSTADHGGHYAQLDPSSDLFTRYNFMYSGSSTQDGFTATKRVWDDNDVDFFNWYQNIRDNQYFFSPYAKGK